MMHARGILNHTSLPEMKMKNDGRGYNKASIKITEMTECEFGNDRNICNFI